MLPPGDMISSVNTFRLEVRSWLDMHWTVDRRELHLRLPFKDRGWDADFSRLMGRHRWIGIGWPRAFGGQGRNHIEQLVFINETTNAVVPVQAHSIGEYIVGPSIISHGTKQQQKTWLPPILRGECSFALGYSEPEAGSDLAALRTRAVRDGDYWIVNGQKLWATGADKAEYIWLAVRTDPGAQRHAGISVLIVDLRSPGITLRPSLSLYGKTFSAQFYDDVRIPSANLIGRVDDGWKVITDALAAERIMISGTRMANIERTFNRLTDYIKSAIVAGAPLRHNPVIRDRIGSLAADIAVARQFLLRSLRPSDNGNVPLHEAAMAKVFTTELQKQLCETAIDILGSGGILSEQSESAPVAEIEQMLRHSIMGIIGGGTNEIQRNIIAQRGLNMPR